MVCAYVVKESGPKCPLKATVNFFDTHTSFPNQCTSILVLGASSSDLWFTNDGHFSVRMCILAIRRHQKGSKMDILLRLVGSSGIVVESSRNPTSLSLGIMVD